MGTEAAMMTWVMPGLDRLRLDFVEAGEKGSAEELEQLSSDLRQRLANHNSPTGFDINVLSGWWAIADA
ncbi:unnamed protein product [Hydatigera taeniaeformis]|uniref:FAD:protein FMN transferase n=1 Tax=Hydatigena taeniaeformis TaxID=6205 RepID=A0A0R3XCP8_HYDTA|nr:unnamed protein product [Hydatigera taeniaeformis]